MSGGGAPGGAPSPAFELGLKGATGPTGRSRVGLLEVHVGEGLAEKVAGPRVHAS